MFRAILLKSNRTQYHRQAEHVRYQLKTMELYTLKTKMGLQLIKNIWTYS